MIKYICIINLLNNKKITMVEKIKSQECIVSSSCVMDKDIMNKVFENIKSCRWKELYEEMNDVWGYDNLSDNKKLDYRIYVMWELPALAKLEIYISKNGGYDNLSENDKKQINELRVNYLSESYFKTYLVKKWDTLWGIIKNKYKNSSDTEITWIINSLKKKNPNFKDTLSVDWKWKIQNIPDWITWDNLKEWEIITL